MNGPWRSARPTRVALAAVLGRGIDGAWWPHTASLGNELPGLIETLHRSLGEIVDISVNWSTQDGAPDLNSMMFGATLMPGWQDRRQRLMVVAGREACVKLLVVPCLTKPALGLMVLRMAAALPISSAHLETREFATADRVVRAAWAESETWANRTAIAHAGPAVPADAAPVRHI
jgi:hypothetical protein